MKTKLIAAIVGMAAFASSASVTISDVIVRQQWPWNGKVNIDYILHGEEGSQHDIAVTLRNGSSVITNEYGSLSGDLIGVTPGRPDRRDARRKADRVGSVVQQPDV